LDKDNLLMKVKTRNSFPGAIYMNAR